MKYRLPVPTTYLLDPNTQELLAFAWVWGLRIWRLFSCIWKTNLVVLSWWLRQDPAGVPQGLRIGYSLAQNAQVASENCLVVQREKLTHKNSGTELLASLTLSLLFYHLCWWLSGRVRTNLQCRLRSQSTDQAESDWVGTLCLAIFRMKPPLFRTLTRRGLPNLGHLNQCIE